MKKGIQLLILSFTMILLVACGSNEKKGTILKNTEVRIKDTVIALDTEVKEDYSDILGAKKDVLESKSCLFDGNDKEYRYEQGTVITYPEGDKNKISSITVNTKEATFSKDIKIGDGLDKVYSIYGESSDTNTTVCTYELGNNSGITFFLENEKIVSIEIYLIQ